MAEQNHNGATLNNIIQRNIVQQNQFNSISYFNAPQNQINSNPGNNAQYIQTNLE